MSACLICGKSFVGWNGRFRYWKRKRPSLNKIGSANCVVSGSRRWRSSVDTGRVAFVPTNWTRVPIVGLRLFCGLIYINKIVYNILVFGTLHSVSNKETTRNSSLHHTCCWLLKQSHHRRICSRSICRCSRPCNWCRRNCRWCRRHRHHYGS